LWTVVLRPLQKQPKKDFGLIIHLFLPICVYIMNAIFGRDNDNRNMQELW